LWHACCHPLPALDAWIAGTNARVTAEAEKERVEQEQMQQRSRDRQRRLEDATEKFKDL